MTKKKYRILLHSMTFKRDFGMIYILSKLLENMGCECIIANNTNIYRPFMKLWNPHAVFIVTFSHIPSIKKHYPRALYFCLSAEGGAIGISDELFFMQNKTVMDAIGRCYLWGQGTLDLITKKLNLLKEENLTAIDIRDKCMIAGSPRMDIVRYSQTISENETGKKKIQIGLIGNFYFLNNIKYNTMQTISIHEFSPDSDSNITVDEIQFQIKLLQAFYKLIKYLDPKKYSFSIRPYPLEDFKTYDLLPDDIEIDSSLEFSSWLVKQDIIIGSTSTTISQIAVAQKPYMNLDPMLNRMDWNYADIFATSLKKHQPKNFKELLNMVENYKDFIFRNQEMGKNLDYYFNASIENSVLYEIARDICKHTGKSEVKNRYIPKFILKGIINLWNSYIAKKTKKELDNDYSYFNYSEAGKIAKAELTQVVDNIISSNKKVY